jgi:hypothetical protein
MGAGMRLEGYVRVTMPPKIIVTGRYDGVDYVFKPDTPLDVPEIVAQHVFGFGLKDKSQALARLGWARTSDEIVMALEKLGTVQFDEPPEMVEVPRKARTKKTGDARPLVNAGGPKVIVAETLSDPATIAPEVSHGGVLMEAPPEPQGQPEGDDQVF